MTLPHPPSRPSVTNKTWLVRAAIAIGLGLVLGAIGGVAGVRRLEPGHPGQTDSLQLVLDSAKARADANDPRLRRRAADSADADQRARRLADSIAVANDPAAPVVPDVISLEESDARRAIELAGLLVGDVQFKAATVGVGVVLATSPIAGRKLRTGSVVNLVLSDGRALRDTSDTLDGSSISRRAL